MFFFISFQFEFNGTTECSFGDILQGGDREHPGAWGSETDQDEACLGAILLIDPS